jgi:hypothetical protein
MVKAFGGHFLMPSDTGVMPPKIQPNPLDYKTSRNPKNKRHPDLTDGFLTYAFVDKEPKNYPLDFQKSQYVMDVATTRHGTLVVGNGAGLHVHVRKSSSLRPPDLRTQ